MNQGVMYLPEAEIISDYYMIINTPNVFDLWLAGKLDNPNCFLHFLKIPRALNSQLFSDWDSFFSLFHNLIFLPMLFWGYIKKNDLFMERYLREK